MAINSPSTKYFGWTDAAAGVKFSVNFPKAPDLELVLIGAELVQIMDQHDRVILHFKGRPFVKGTEIKQHDPVNFIFESQKVKRKFSGFVHVVDPDYSMKKTNTDIICVGASALLKKPDKKTYINVTADQVISKIAKKNGLKAVTQKHPRKRKIVVQTGDTTDWQLCRRLAKQCGFALIAENSSITFMSKTKIFDTNKKNAPYFFYVDYGPSNIASKAERNTGTITSFDARLSDESPELGIGVNRVIAGVHEKTGKAIVTKHPKEKADLYATGAPAPGETFTL